MKDRAGWVWGCWHEEEGVGTVSVYHAITWRSETTMGEGMHKRTARERRCAVQLFILYSGAIDQSQMAVGHGTRHTVLLFLHHHQSHPHCSSHVCTQHTTLTSAQTHAIADSTAPYTSAII